MLAPSVTVQFGLCIPDDDDVFELVVVDDVVVPEDTLDVEPDTVDIALVVDAPPAPPVPGRNGSSQPADETAAHAAPNAATPKPNPRWIQRDMINLLLPFALREREQV